MLCCHGDVLAAPAILPRLLGWMTSNPACNNSCLQVRKPCAQAVCMSSAALFVSLSTPSSDDGRSFSARISFFCVAAGWQLGRLYGFELPQRFRQLSRQLGHIVLSVLARPATPSYS